MVNKQYNVQKLGKNKTNHIDAKEQLKQSITVIPNETIGSGSSDVRDFYHPQNAFERNITQQYYHSINDTFDVVDGQFETKRILSHNTSMADTEKHSSNSMANAAADANDTQSQKQLSIDDIERFQYILQMDREMVSGRRSDRIRSDQITLGQVRSGQTRAIQSCCLGLYIFGVTFQQFQIHFLLCVFINLWPININIYWHE